ncbi:hypothetical protein Ancab_035049 [Ancistrocladus abbreviatus]
MAEEEQGTLSTATDTLTSKQQQKAALCEECNTNLSKYTCPGCSLRTCSLSCVKSHKLRTCCSGKRDLSQSIPLCQFDDNLLISDFNLLEDVRRVAESARRVRAKVCGYSHFKLPFHLRSLRNAAASRRTKLWFLPSGMTKREKNQSRYNQRKKCISWTLEWRFHSTDVVLLDHGVHESTNLQSVIEKHLQPSPWNHKLRKFCNEQLEHLKFFIRRYPKGPKSPFCELDVNAAVSQLLANLVILEYPVIHVFLPSHSYDFEVVKHLPVESELKACKKDDCPSPKGILFKEEEIEDGSTPDPQILDLLNSSGADAALQTSHRDRQSEKELNNSAYRQPVTRTFQSSSFGSHATENDNSLPAANTEEMKDFEFDQDLIDAYSFIIAQSNPDDFLDFETEADAGKDHLKADGISPVQEELEEVETGVTIFWFPRHCSCSLRTMNHTAVSWNCII